MALLLENLLNYNLLAAASNWSPLGLVAGDSSSHKRHLRRKEWHRCLLLIRLGFLVAPPEHKETRRVQLKQSAKAVRFEEGLFRDVLH